MNEKYYWLNFKIMGTSKKSLVNVFRNFQRHLVVV